MPLQNRYFYVYSWAIVFSDFAKSINMINYTALMSDEFFLVELDRVLEEMVLDQEFTITELCQALATSRTSLHRKITRMANKSISVYIREFRLQKAHKKLQKKSKSVSEIAYEVGFSNLAYFSRCFKAYYGISPSSILDNQI